MGCGWGLVLYWYCRDDLPAWYQYRVMYVRTIGHNTKYYQHSRSVLPVYDTSIITSEYTKARPGTSENALLKLQTLGMPLHHYVPK